MPTGLRHKVMTPGSNIRRTLHGAVNWPPDLAPPRQNLRPGHHELAVDAPSALRVAAAFTELARAV